MHGQENIKLIYVEVGESVIKFREDVVHLVDPIILIQIYIWYVIIRL
jgi:hypothetical protein